jgi:hypothetical protein
MSEIEKLNEEQVFKQEVADDELEAVAGGKGYKPPTKDDCTELHKRDIYQGGFPNCAATVEDGSWCDTNDACKAQQVNYYNMSCKVNSCTKSWA